MMNDFQIQFRVRYAETDAMGVVHHAVYPVWFEMGRTEFLREAGMTYRAMESRGLLSPVVAIQLRYLKPAQYDDMITLTVRIIRYTGVRLKIGYKVFSDNVLLCTGESEHAFIYDNRPTALQKSCPDIHELMLLHAMHVEE
jgi:acyl-CoA thioester hydrolase